MKKLLNHRFVIINSMIFSFIFTLGGCQTTDIYSINAEQIKNKKFDEIFELKLKDSTFVRAADENEIKYYDKIKDQPGVFVYSQIDTTLKLLNIGSSVKKIHKYIAINEVEKIKIGKDKFDLGSTILLAGGIALVLFLIAGAIAGTRITSIRF